ncbi:Mitochondrial distribution and morphology protein 12 [Diatrype stigma]|uniref:Mitochondrial distribution and morphology protein 12 n=1 Tax=Diatrype stigma TaxID=117547 RepID=A0AAN9YMQ2_9PEZI
MSIELNWETLTGGPDGSALAESIRDFIHAKFQTVPLPRFIKSVRVHEFAFGAIPPDVVLKDICDPLPDFYEQDDGDEDDDDDDEDEDGDGDGHGSADGEGGSRGESDDANAHASAGAGSGAGYGAAEEFIPDSIRAAERRRRAEQSRRFGVGGSAPSTTKTTTNNTSSPRSKYSHHSHHHNSHHYGGAGAVPPPNMTGTEFPFPPQPHIHAAGLRSGLATPAEFGSAPFIGLASASASAAAAAVTPGVPGGTSNMHYLQLQSKLVGPGPGGWSGAQTPLAAMAGGAQHHLSGWLDAGHHLNHPHNNYHNQPHNVHHLRNNSYNNNNGYNSNYNSSNDRRRNHNHGQPQNQNQNLHPSWPPPKPRGGNTTTTAGQHGGGGRGVHNRDSSQGSLSGADFPASTSPSSLAPPGQPPHGYPPLREKHSVSTLAPTSTSASRPPTRDRASGPLLGMAGSKAAIDANAAAAAAASAERTKNRSRAKANNTTTRGGGRRGEEEYYYVEGEEEYREGEEEEEEEEPPRRYREPRPEDLQAVFRIRYAGDVRLMLTAEILLDYPMPSFVGIPVKLNITGLTFDGVGVVAYIRKRVHFCFLSPEDAVTALGGVDGDSDDDDDDGGDGGGGGGGRDGDRGRTRRRRGDQHGDDAGHGGNSNNNNNNKGAGGKGAAAETPRAKKETKKGRMGGLLQEIRVESEIGQREGSKQSLKNVGKVERFVLEQVRRIFEEEFVYPSFWTFLV